jgi:hypothetical protein
MSAHRRIRPGADEFASFYAGYVQQVPDGDIVEALIGGAEISAALLGDLPDDLASRAYGPGKWTLKEVVLHCADTERIFAYRALRIARGDTTPLPGFDENAYTPLSGAASRTLEDILDELQSVREASVTLFSGLPSEAWTRRGMASGKEVSVRGIAWITAGHLLHHMGVIQDRYL